MQALRRLEYEATIVSAIVLEEIRLRLTAPIDMTVRGTLEEEIQQGNIRLQELEEERVWLRKKSALVDAKVKMMEDEIKEDFLRKNTIVERLDAYDRDNKFKPYCHELISLMSWLEPPITKHSD